MDSPTYNARLPLFFSSSLRDPPRLLPALPAISRSLSLSRAQHGWWVGLKEKAAIVAVSLELCRLELAGLPLVVSAADWSAVSLLCHSMCTNSTTLEIRTLSQHYSTLSNAITQALECIEIGRSLCEAKSEWRSFNYPAAPLRHSAPPLHSDNLNFTAILLSSQESLPMND
jgi:hypothetical protein